MGKSWVFQRHWAKVAALLTLAGGILVYTVMLCIDSSDTKNRTAKRPAPEFELPDSTGKKRHLADWGGKPLVIHFWASWCAPCLDEIPVFLRAARKSNHHGLQWLAISLDDKWSDALRVFKEDGEMPNSKNLTLLLDAGGKLPERYGTYQYPETYLLNSKHEIVTKWVGSQDWAGETLGASIDSALREPSH